MAERFAAAAQVMLAALAQDDLCLFQTQINVRIENRNEGSTPTTEYIESLPSNDGREWVVRLTPISASDDANPGKIETELLAMLTMILREASLLPEADLSACVEKAFARGLGHKLSPGRPYDQLAAAFAANTESEIERAAYNAPWESAVRGRVKHTTSFVGRTGQALRIRQIEPVNYSRHATRIWPRVYASLS